MGILGIAGAVACLMTLAAYASNLVAAIWRDF